MNVRKALHAACLVAGISMLSLPTHGALFRAYISSAGSDSNPCTITQPCRLLPAALAAVADGGEIWMLDSANYNSSTVTISKSVTILSVPGAVGSVVSIGLGNDAIDISGSGINVTLRHLVIGPFPGGSGHGVAMVQGSTLTIDDCAISGVNGSGVLVNSAGKVRITGSTMQNNGVAGIWVNGALSSTTTIDVAETTLAGNDKGIVIDSGDASTTLHGAIRNSRITQNNNVGVYALSESAGDVTFTVSNSIISDNGTTGLSCQGGGARVWATGNTVNGNGLGFDNACSFFNTDGRNAVQYNGSDSLGTIQTQPTL
jgi:hypothetical protein